MSKQCAYLEIMLYGNGFGANYLDQAPDSIGSVGTLIKQVIVQKFGVKTLAKT